MADRDFMIVRAGDAERAELRRTAIEFDRERMRRHAWEQAWYMRRRPVIAKMPGAAGWLCRVIGALTGRVGMGIRVHFAPSLEQWMQVLDQKEGSK